MRLIIFITLASLLLAACSGHNDAKTFELPDFGSGARHVVVSGDTASNGLALIGADGKAYLMLGNDSNAASTVVYRRSSSNARWGRVPETTESPILAVQLNEADAATAPTLPSTATTLRTSLNDAVVTFILQPTGNIVASASGCQVSGKLNSAVGQPAARVKLRFEQCGPITGNYNGVAFVDADAANADIHIVVDNGTAIQDFYAYAQ
ncbi:hypothetical protein [Stenotrophobium rhamnosiphilum]|uniref:Lipoprotein n=1 Tax=Stenotrophobium rhamnosiphilum TaxID=2029166 RepID=A0A2T5MCE2_9GAMM|nr:hypothetical protein [Stenotrophobium rhamnosiphilum]PTU30248.1 hypothetical protein CJD38_14955 [Stenotrophobium rhamnosiphilum]